jgi:hypothetical protein
LKEHLRRIAREESKTTFLVNEYLVHRYCIYCTEALSST